MADMGDMSTIMQQASKMKSAQMAQDRPKFDAQPEYMQATFFHSPDLTAARQLSFKERVGAASRLNDAGKPHFDAGEFDRALETYQEALGVWCYIEPLNDEWRKKGIKDSNLRIHHDWRDVVPVSSDLAESTRNVVVNSYLNIAACAIKLERYVTARRACTDALEVQPGCVKALYRRSQALILPKSSGGAELDAAIRDLAAARRVEPGNVAVKKALISLRKQKERQDAVDRETFAGMFDRGNIVDEQEESKAKAAAEAKAAKEKQQETVTREIARLQGIARQWRREGKHKDADELEQHIATVAKKSSTFTNPTPEMQEQAAKMGIDLNDPAVQAELEKLQAEQLGLSSAGKGSKKKGGLRARAAAGAAGAGAGAGAGMTTTEFDDDDDDAGHPLPKFAKPKNKAEEVAQLKAMIQAAPREVLVEFLTEKGGYSNADVKAMLTKELRAAMLKIVNQPQQPKNKRSWLQYVAFTGTFAFFLWRMYSTGMLGWVVKWLSGQAEEDDIHAGWGDEDLDAELF